MIVYDLICRAGGHRFEGWFTGSADYETQCAAGLLRCPLCDGEQVDKDVMAPNVAAKSTQRGHRETPAAPTEGEAGGQLASVTPSLEALVEKLHAAQSEALAQSTWVGGSFAEEARAIHYGETDPRQIHGEADAGEARDLAEEGVPVMPLPFPMVPPEAQN